MIRFWCPVNEIQTRKILITDNKTLRFPKQIALISAPWPLFSRPSIQLGALKAYLKTVSPDLSVTCYHFFLTLAKTVGYPVYHILSNETWLAESIYAALLYPEQMEPIRRFFMSHASKHRELNDLDFLDLTGRIQSVSDTFIEKTDWAAMDMVGLSICLCQLTASLYFFREIRRRAPDLPLIAGGSIIGGRTAMDLLTAFPEIDLIVFGEGEKPLARIIRHLQDGGTCRDIPPTAGIVSRNDEGGTDSTAFDQLPDLTDLPVPDFSEYFETLAKFPADKRFFPILPMEISRGCWWRVERPDPEIRRQPQGCAFCNLNLQWQGYRSKVPDQVIHEIEYLTDIHKVLSVAFMDNALPLKNCREIFKMLAEKGKDFQFFGELRATTPRRMLEVLSTAGLRRVQIGIESLSSRLLKKLNKGTTAMDNIEIMKHCEALGIKNMANLILHFPGSDAADVTETLRAITFARFFRPLRIVYFWLGMDSPVWENPRSYGLTAVFNHPHYRKLFPENICRRMRFMVQDYRGDKMFQRKLWQPVIQAVEKWRQDYQQLHAGPYAGPILTLHDGQSFLFLRERRVGAEPVNHRLEGTSRKIYLFCDHQRGFEEIKTQFASMSVDKIRSFLTMMTDKKLMFADNEQYLSLAVCSRIPVR